MYTPEIRAAAARAADWLAANPTKHIARNLAVTAEGRRTSPTFPDADCFCALGRLGKELDLNFRNGRDYVPLIDLHPDMASYYDDVFDKNDTGSALSFDREDLRIVVRHPELGIEALRNIAEGKKP